MEFRLFEIYVLGFVRFYLFFYFLSFFVSNGKKFGMVFVDVGYRMFCVVCYYIWEVVDD